MHGRSGGSGLLMAASALLASPAAFGQVSAETSARILKIPMQAGNWEFQRFGKTYQKCMAGWEWEVNLKRSAGVSAPAEGCSFRSVALTGTTVKTTIACPNSVQHEEVEYANTRMRGREEYLPKGGKPEIEEGSGRYLGACPAGSK
jgi:hypothetical protein